MKKEDSPSLPIAFPVAAGYVSTASLPCLGENRPQGTTKSKCQVSCLKKTEQKRGQRNRESRDRKEK